MLIRTTDGIEVEAYDCVEVSIDGGEFMQYATIKDRQDAAYAINKCRSGSHLSLDGRVFRFRITRGKTVVFERSE